jgi:hypothetical protein
MDHERIDKGKRRLHLPHDTILLPIGKRTRMTAGSPEHQNHESTTDRTPRIIRDEVLLFPSGTPISYNFHSCDVTLIRVALHRIQEEDLPLNLNLGTITFSLPKCSDDDGSAISWLISLITCLAWCFHSSPIPRIIITEPELCLKEPYIGVNETDQAIRRTDLCAGPPNDQSSATSTTSATGLVITFLIFTQGLPRSEMDTEEQVIFALADFLHDCIERCKSCVLWRAAWKECLNVIYGKEVARSMVRRRKFQPACR